MGHGVYGRHSLAQHSAGGFGLPGLTRAAQAAATDRGRRHVGRHRRPRRGRRPQRAAADDGGHRDAPGGRRLRPDHGGAHRHPRRTTSPSLFETIEHDPDTYLTLDGVYALAAGRSFYGRIFPPESLTLAWSAIAVHWISRVPMPIHGHVYSPFATGEVARRVPRAVGRRLAGLPRVASRRDAPRRRDARRRRRQPGRRRQRRRTVDERPRRGDPRGGRPRGR